LITPEAEDKVAILTSEPYIRGLKRKGRLIRGSAKVKLCSKLHVKVDPSDFHNLCIDTTQQSMSTPCKPPELVMKKTQSHNPKLLKTLKVGIAHLMNQSVGGSENTVARRNSDK